MGFLSGKYRTQDDLLKSARGKGVQNYLNPRGLKILEALDSVSKRYDTNPASIALAWLIARPSITAPIASATSVKQLMDLIKAVQISLDDSSIYELDAASSY